jgi:7-keto-8-aminopelargonate synthetase-like enzyme
MAKPRSISSRANTVQTIERMFVDQEEAGLIRHRAGSSDGATWVVDGRPMRNFASCSYMGLERHPELLAGAMDALTEFGSNFAISRAYLQCPLYDALEETLGEAMNGHVLVAPSTTLAHLAALPVLVGDRDLVLVDQLTHASVHMATNLIDDVPIEIVRHNRMDLLERRLGEAGDDYDRVWYLCDGVYSMLGDFAPFAELSALMRRFPKLHLYVDDAHAMSWTGRHGRGAARSRLAPLDRVVVAASLAKAFGANGGALVLPTEELRDRVRRCGGPMMFSGPLVPPVLGAALASARLHLRPEFEDMQGELRERLALASEGLAAAGLDLATDARTPVRVLHCGSVAAAQAVVRTMRERGFFMCISTFPAVPVNKPSVRFTISRHNSLADIRDMIDCLAEARAAAEELAAAGDRVADEPRGLS